MSDSIVANPLDAVRKMTATKRFVVLGVAAVSLVGIWMVGSWASQPNYVPLYEDLELGEVGTITEALAQSDISYRLASGGSGVLVSDEDLARARVTLARDGLSVGSRPGLELFDQPSWGMTDFTQRVTYQRALEGELARTIGGLRGVQRAQVHLVLPKTNSFRNQDKQVGASVVVQLSPGSSLNPETVRGITYIVANSVEQLNSEDVAVLDDAGHVLSVPAANASVSGLTSRQLDIQQSVEEHLVSKVERLLSTVVGLGRARVQVSAQLNFEQVDRTIESFDPDGQVVQTEQRSETGDGTAAAGVGSQKIISNSYQNSRRLERIVGAVGGITRLTVAVLVDENALESGELAEGGTANRLASVDAMVRDAIGIDAARGDRLTVTAIPFMPLSGGDGPAIGMIDAPEQSFDVIDMIQRLSRPVLGLAAIAALIALAWSVLKTTPALPPAVSGGTQPGSVPATDTVVDLPATEQVPPAVQLQSHLNKATERPELAAQVVRAWLGGTT